jgi:hypothetical protein
MTTWPPVEPGLFVTCSIGPDRDAALAVAGKASATVAVNPARILRFIAIPRTASVSGQ